MNIGSTLQRGEDLNCLAEKSQNLASSTMGLKCKPPKDNAPKQKGPSALSGFFSGIANAFSGFGSKAAPQQPEPKA